MVRWFYGLYPMDFIGLSPFLSLLATTGILLVIASVMGVEFGLLGLVFQKLRPKKTGKALLLLAALWVVLEALQRYGPTGFPWGHLSASQWGALPVIQSASVFGSLFLSGLIVLFAAALAAVFKESKKLPLLVAAALVLSNAAWGAWRLSAYAPGENTVTASVLQANCPSYVPHDRNPEDVYYNLAQDAGGELVAMCENAVEVVLANSDRVQNRFMELGEEKNAEYIIGAFDEEGEDAFSSVHLVSPEHGFATYRKQHLVPFGEYMPFGLATLIPELADMNAVGMQLVPGDGPQLFKTRHGSVGALICFDSVFAPLARRSVSEGANLLVVSTNDSWFDNTTGKAQHYGQAVLRAVENGRYVLRAANTGLSGIINPVGETIASVPDMQAGAADAPVEFLTEKTFYTRAGDLVWLFSVMCVLWFGFQSKFWKKDEKING